MYGLPDHELFAASERGDVALGGCLICDESPDFECRGCGAALPYTADDDWEDLAPDQHLAHYPRGNLATPTIEEDSAVQIDLAVLPTTGPA